MTIDDRLREAAREARAVVAQREAPAPARAHRAARRRGALVALSAATVVVVAVVVAALVGDGGGPPPSVAPAGPEATTTVAAVADDAVPVVPEGAVRVPIGGAGAAQAAAARQVVEKSDGAPAEVLGVVGETVLLAVDQGGGVECLAVADLPSVTTDCALGGPELTYTISQLPDDSFRAQVSGKLPPGATILVVTAGDTTYTQDARDGWVFLPVDVAARPVRVEARADDGRVVAAPPVGGRLVEAVEQVLRLRLLAATRDLAADPDPAEQEVIDAQAKALDAGIVSDSDAATFDELLALAEQRLEEVRREVLARATPPVDAPAVIPVPDGVTAALGDTGGLAAGPVDGPIWVVGALRVADGQEEPALLLQVDPATGRLLASHEIGPPMHHLAAGTERVWFGRAGDGALPTSAVGYYDLESGDLDRVETDLSVVDVVLANDAGTSAYLVAQAGEAPVVARLGSTAIPAPLALDWGPAALVAGAPWPGGLLVSDDAGSIWRIDASAETAAPFAAVGGAAFVMAPATGPEPGVWTLVWDDPGVRAVLLDDGGEVVTEHDLAGDTRDLVSDGVAGAFALTQSGEVLFLAESGEPALVTRVDPGSPDTGFAALARFGTTLWLLGGVDGLVSVELGQ